MCDYEGPSWLYEIHDNLSPQKLEFLGTLATIIC